jgi:hypothetical protein
LGRQKVDRTFEERNEEIGQLSEASSKHNGTKPITYLKNFLREAKI